MVTFSILIIAIFALVLLIAAVLSIGGVSLLIVFGDVIVCVAIIVFIVKFIQNRKK